MRLIDADGLKKLTTERNEIWNAVTDSRGRGLTEIIDSLPAVEVAPVVHAHWFAEKDDGGFFDFCLCSNCKFDFRNEIAWLMPSAELPYYCPRCGASMDEEGCFDGCT